MPSFREGDTVRFKAMVLDVRATQNSNLHYLTVSTYDGDSTDVKAWDSSIIETLETRKVYTFDGNIKIYQGKREITVSVALDSSFKRFFHCINDFC